VKQDSPAPLVLEDPGRVGLLAAELVLNRLCARPHARLLLPTGRSPQGMYAAVRAHAAAGRLPSSGATVLQLDEYVGIGPSDPRSFAAQLRAALRGVPLGSLETLDGAARDLAAETARHESLVEGAPIDLAVLGLGRDGHVAFDEPPARLASGVRRVTLAPQTRADAAAAFGGSHGVPADALTVGLGTLRRARELILLATGSPKAPALRAMLEEPVGESCPASLLRDHPRLTVICDREAAGLLAPRSLFASDRVLVVLGHRDPGVDGEHVVSFQSRARLRRARRLAERSPVRAAVLTGYTGDRRVVGGRADEGRLGRACRASAARGRGPQHRRERLALASDPAGARRDAARDSRLLGLAPPRAVVLRAVSALRTARLLPRVVLPSRLAAATSARATRGAPRGLGAPQRHGGGSHAAAGGAQPCRR